MTGGLGFVKDGQGNQNRNRRMVREINDKHFKAPKPQSNFSRKYRTSKAADAKTLQTIRKQTQRAQQNNLIKHLILVSLSVVIVVLMIYIFASL